MRIIFMRKKLNINEHLDTSFEDAWASFIISQTAKGISETTLRNYRTHLRAISKHLNISASLSDLSKSDLEAMIVSMRGSGLAHNTIATYLRCVNTFLNWCRLEELADLSIADGRLRYAVFQRIFNYCLPKPHCLCYLFHSE